MCVVIGKYFEEYGWVGIKNRDRNYTPSVSLKKKYKDDTEILYYWDNITQWCEGINSAGIAVLSASLMVSDDEKEYKTCSEKKPSKTGKKIQKILRYNTIDDVVEQAIKEKLTGNTIIFTKDRLFLLEGAWRPGEYATEGYYFEAKEVDKTETIVRTNHGIWLPDTGYQKVEGDWVQTWNRVSSNCRLRFSTICANESNDPFVLLDKLTLKIVKDLQLTPCRVVKQAHDMRTTAQIMLVPGLETMYVRNFEGELKVNFSKLNSYSSKTWVEILSSRIVLSQKSVFSGWD